MHYSMPAASRFSSARQATPIRRARSSVCVIAAFILAVAPITLPAQDVSRQRLMRAGDVDTLPVRDAGVRIAYGSDSLQFGELRMPAGPGPHPLAIVLHGGCWFSPYASARNSAPLAEALTQAGVATWNVEYRRYDHPGGAWPGTFRDAASGADFVRTLAAKYAIDTTRVVAIGHSAGAQLAAWLPTRERLSPSSDVYTAAPIQLAGVVSLGGVMDMREYQTRQTQTCGNPAIESVMGGLPADRPERYRDVSPIERLPLGVSHTHVAGAMDRIAPRATVDIFADSARSLGDSVTVVTVPGLGHHDVMSPRSAAGRAAIDAVLLLLRMPTTRP